MPPKNGSGVLPARHIQNKLPCSDDSGARAFAQASSAERAPRIARDQIIAKNPIVQFVEGRGHDLKRAGENFETDGCPITQHKRGHRPNTIYQGKQSWFCHDCGKGGTVIDWVMHERNVTAAEAMRILGGGCNDEVKKRRALIVATYPYQDASGKLLFEVVRLQPKDFRQRRPDEKGGWIWNLTGVERVLYRLPEIMRDVRDGLTIYICAGEKDVLKMVEHGFAASTNPGGEGHWLDSYSETLRDADVVIIADKDTKGREHAHDVAAKLRAVAKFVRVIELPDLSEKKVKDPHDFFAAGGIPEQLQQIVNDAPEWRPPSDMGAAQPSETDDAVTPDDFYAYMPMHNYIFIPARDFWPGASVNARLPAIKLSDETIKASTWLDKNRPVEQMTWAPGMPMLIKDRLISEGGWIERSGCS